MNKKIASRTIAVFALWIACASTAQALPQSVKNLFHEGDLIFQRSQSSQAQAIYEATGSRWSHVGVLIKEGGIWKVLEAIDPVSVTTVDAWARRGANGQVRVFRPKVLESGAVRENIRKVKSALAAYLGDRYDIFFEWTDSRIYCSELTYKAYESALGVKLGVIQKWKDLNLEGPAVKRLIEERMARYGRELDLEQPIITPVAQMESTELRKIYETPGTAP